MKTSRMIAVALVIAVLLGTTASAAFAQATTPIGPQWWPSRWGPGDEAGASNLMTPEKVLEAVKLITAGEGYRPRRGLQPGQPTAGLGHQQPRPSSLSTPRAPPTKTPHFNPAVLPGAG